MLHDPHTYKNPGLFDPARFLGPNPEQDPSVCVWGFGRRICAGRVFADASFFLACTSALATLKLSKAIDKNGAPIEPEARHTGLVIM
jgi:cytochrome P450